MPSDSVDGAALLCGVALGAALVFTFAAFQSSAYNFGRQRGAEEINEIIAAYARGKRDQRKASQLHVAHEGNDGR